MSNSCCGARPSLCACSGAADVRALANQATRRLSKQDVDKMLCFAGVVARVSGMLNTTEAADKSLAIAGCPLDWGKKCLEQAGFTKFEHLRLAEIGLEKGKSLVSDKTMTRVVGQQELLTRGCCS